LNNREPTGKEGKKILIITGGERRLGRGVGWWKIRGKNCSLECVKLTAERAFRKFIHAMRVPTANKETTVLRDAGINEVNTGGVESVV